MVRALSPMPAVLGLTLALGQALAPGPARAAWLCVGTTMPFMMTLDGATARFDYLGDGRFGIDPPVTEAIGASSLHDLVTRRARLAFVLSPETCRALRATLPVRIDIGIPRNGTLSVQQGCCLWRDIASSTLPGTAPDPAAGPGRSDQGTVPQPVTIACAHPPGPTGPLPSAARCD